MSGFCCIFNSRYILGFIILFCGTTHLRSAQNNGSQKPQHVPYYLMSAPSLWSWLNTHRPSLWPICGVSRQLGPPAPPLTMDIRPAFPAPQRRRLADDAESIWPKTHNDPCWNEWGCLEWRYCLCPADAQRALLSLHCHGCGQSGVKVYMTGTVDNNQHFNTFQLSRCYLKNLGYVMK